MTWFLDSSLSLAYPCGWCVAVPCHELQLGLVGRSFLSSLCWKETYHEYWRLTGPFSSLEDLLLWDQPFGEPVYQIPQSVTVSVILTDCGPLLPTVKVIQFASGLELHLSLFLGRQPLTLPSLCSSGMALSVWTHCSLTCKGLVESAGHLQQGPVMWVLGAVYEALALLWGSPGPGTVNSKRPALLACFAYWPWSNGCVTVLEGHDRAGAELAREAQDLLSSLSWQVLPLVYLSVSVIFFSLHCCQTCGRNNRQVQKVQAVGTVSGSSVKQSVMVLVVWGRADSSLNLTGTCWEWLLLCTDSEMELSTDLCPVQGHLSCLPDK